MKCDLCLLPSSQNNVPDSCNHQLCMYTFHRCPSRKHNLIYFLVEGFSREEFFQIFKMHYYHRHLPFSRSHSQFYPRPHKIYEWYLHPCSPPKQFKIHIYSDCNQLHRSMQKGHLSQSSPDLLDSIRKIVLRHSFCNEGDYQRVKK